MWWFKTALMNDICYYIICNLIYAQIYERSSVLNGNKFSNGLNGRY